MQKQVQNVGKHATTVSAEKIDMNRDVLYLSSIGACYVQLVPSAGKHPAGAKRGKTCKQCQAWENIKPVRSAETSANQVTIGLSIAPHWSNKTACSMWFIFRPCSTGITLTLTLVSSISEQAQQSISSLADL